MLGADHHNHQYHHHRCHHRHHPHQPHHHHHHDRYQICCRLLSLETSWSYLDSIWFLMVSISLLEANHKNDDDANGGDDDGGGDDDNGGGGDEVDALCIMHYANQAKESPNSTHSCKMLHCAL